MNTHRRSRRPRLCSTAISLALLLAILLSIGGSLAIASAAPARNLLALQQSWSKNFGNTGYDNGTIGSSIATDSAGNIYVTGCFSETVDFGGGPFVVVYSPDIFLAKYDTDGNHLWSKQFGGTVIDCGNGLAVDSAGNVFVTGYFQGNVDFGGGPLTGGSYNEIFLAKYDTNGNHLWSKRFGGVENDHGYGLAVDASGNVLITGNFRGSVDFGGGLLTSASDYDDSVFVAKYDGSGNHLWSKRFGSEGFNEGRTVTMASNGDFYLTGRFSDSIDFGGGALVKQGFGYFVVKFDAAGNHIWSRQFLYGDDSVAVNSLAVNPSGGTYITGGYQNDVYLARLDSNGAVLWSKITGRIGIDYGQSLYVDSFGNVVVCGLFEYAIDLGGELLIAEGIEDLFLAKFDPDGRHLFSKKYGSDIDFFLGGFKILPDPVGNILMMGNFHGTIDLGSGPLYSDGAQDMLLAKIVFPKVFLPVAMRGE